MKTILVGIDCSPRTKDVLASAIALARRHGAKLVLFRAVTVPTEPEPEDYCIPPGDYRNVLEKRARAELDAATASVPDELVLRRSVGLAIPWEGVCEAAKENDADCIVIGSHGYGALDRLLGTTAAKVVNHADRSVLVVRAADRLAA